ncbi:MAG TPA: YicC family protein, partial [Synergistaceae bacterium]|nr:YicC family protein [Synergistaceae bacterium]
MMRSMTGFARETRVFEWGTLTVEISTVNHRYQELSLRLPREMSALEGPVGGLIRSRLGRGKVRFSAEITWAPRYRTFTIDRDVLHGYYNQLASIAQDMGVGDNPSVTALLGLPGVIEAPSLDGTVEETV